MLTMCGQLSHACRAKSCWGVFLKVAHPGSTTARTVPSTIRLNASSALDLIFRPCLSDRLPLHVRGHILPALGQRSNVIDDVPGAAIRIAALLHEVALRYFAALDLPVRVARAALTFRRRRFRIGGLALRDLAFERLSLRLAP